jgi:GNAT superfamily N-acetyltransferase
MKADDTMMGDRQAPDDDPAIRRARPAETGVLSALALRSKAHWGYDADFLAACRDDLTLSPEEIATSAVYVCDGVDAPLGYYRLVLLDGGVAELDALFVEPAAMGQGIGKRLWWHAVATAAKLGCAEMVWQSDPQAEGFYLAMGARRAGESESTVSPGRMLPFMRFRLQQDPPRDDGSRP